MIKFELLRDAGVLVVEPKGALSTEDFDKVARTVDLYIAEKEKADRIAGRGKVISWLGGLWCAP